MEALALFFPKENQIIGPLVEKQVGFPKKNFI
jgi:hypothetical protein